MTANFIESIQRSSNAILHGVYMTNLHAALWFLIAITVVLVLRNYLPASTRSVLWLLVLLRFLVPTPSTAPVDYRLPKTETVEFARTAVDPFATQLPEGTVGYEVAAGYPISTADILVAIWLLGTSVLVGRELFLMWRLGALVRRSRKPNAAVVELARECAEASGLRRGVRVLLSEQVAGPCLAGWLRPKILIDPVSAGGLSELRWRHVLQHECEHLRRRDPLRLLVGRIACLLCWWNPLVWLAQRELRRASEEACDSATLGRLGEGERRAYGETLLAVASAAPVGAASNLAPSLGITGACLRQRIVAISAGGSTTGRSGSVFSSGLVAVALFSLALPHLSLADEEKPGEPTAESPYGIGSPEVVALLEESRGKGYFGDLPSVSIRGRISRGNAQGIPTDFDRSEAKSRRALDAPPLDPEKETLDLAWDGSRFAAAITWPKGDRSVRLWDGDGGADGQCWPRRRWRPLGALPRTRTDGEHLSPARPVLVWGDRTRPLVERRLPDRSLGAQVSLDGTEHGTL